MRDSNNEVTIFIEKYTKQVKRHLEEDLKLFDTAPVDVQDKVRAKIKQAKSALETIDLFNSIFLD